MPPRCLGTDNDGDAPVCIVGGMNPKGGGMGGSSVVVGAELLVLSISAERLSTSTVSLAI